MLNQLFTPAAIRRTVQEIPDSRVLPFGGPWGQRVADADSFHDELTEFDRQVPVAADLLAYGATSRDVREDQTEIVANRAVRIKQSSNLKHEDLLLLASVRESGSPTLAANLQARVRNIIMRRRQAVEITRGILLAGAAAGDLEWTNAGYNTGTLDFGMPDTLKYVPDTYWIDNAGAAQSGADPVTDIIAVNQEASLLGGAPYTDIDMSRAAFMAMVGTTEFQNQAKALSAVYSVASLPVAGSDASIRLASTVLGMTVHLVDNTFTKENSDGTRTTGYYSPQKYAILWRAEGLQSGMDFANCPVIESAVASAMGSSKFGSGIVRGTVDYVTGDEQEFTWVRFHATKEGVPRRNSRTVTARILVVEPA